MNGTLDSPPDFSSDDESSPDSTGIHIQNAGNHLPKRPRTSSHSVSTTPSGQREPECAKNENALLRVSLRSLTYFFYDGFPITSGYREFARVGKVLIELVIDERYPPPRRADMSLSRKCLEFLLAPAASSFAWFIVRNIRNQGVPRSNKANFMRNSLIWIKGIWTVVHRVGRQALIYRLFFSLGTLKYSLASALGIVCCFFKESIFPDIVRLGRWPKHFSASQGMAAILRSFVYAAAFALPLQNVSKTLRDSPRRRGNVKKLIFALALSQTQKLVKLYNLVVGPQRLLTS
ncbi:hypothetical protein BWQ96_00918 [Gracilariopsis chorda]|uniref:Uncharacterized protein n=1 Tax=Gracilariopsis chorda TaxID=448386 RepID=A0A2V3J4N8_9FLOR|nr:hypothetical protein BWQ96_00918 [Gracilariopsis chorda]|eukprot:PXF49344.1 hypothetical protein BWQ96_00918 [Gracilariopsis chorda]